MLSKILNPEDEPAVQPLVWRRAPGVPAERRPTAPVAGMRPEAPAPAPPPAAKPQYLYSVADEYEQQIAQQKQQIAQLQARVAEVEMSLDKRVRETRDAAYREGEAAGVNHVQAVLDRLARSIQELGEMRHKLRQETESDLLQLSFAIARKILNRELSADPDAVAALVRLALDKVRMREVLRVRINPQHQPIVQHVIARISPGSQIEILPEPRFDLGSVVVETTRGDFDVSIDTQMKEIERGLADRLVKR